MKYIVTVIEPHRNQTWFQTFDTVHSKQALVEMADWLYDEQGIHPLETEFVDVEPIFEQDYDFVGVGGL